MQDPNDTQGIRGAFLNTAEKTEDVPVPDWLAPHVHPETQLAIKDVPSATLTLLRKQYLRSQDQDESVFAAAIICKCLINKLTGELVFQPSDRDALAQLGSTKLMPLFDQLTEFLGYNQNAIADAKKN